MAWPGIAPAGADDEPDLAARLWALARMPSPEARRTEVDALLDLDVPVSAWATAAASAPRHEPETPGTRRETVRMFVAGAAESTQVTVHVPTGYDARKPAPLLMVFHGTGGNGAGVAKPWIPLADELGMLVVSPYDARGDNGYTHSAVEREAAWAALRWARLRYNVDENRIFATGSSRGGHLVWDLALRSPDRFAAIAPMIGGPRLSNRGGQNNMRYLENLVDVPIRDLQGAADDPFLVQNLRMSFRSLEAFGATDAKLVEFPELGHSYDLGAVDWAAFLGGAVRDPAPARLVRRAARADQGRAFFAEILELKSTAKETYPLKVDPRKWGRLSEAQKRAAVAQLAESKTARLEIKMSEPGRFTAKREHVKRYRLLVTEAMLDDEGYVVIRSGGRKKRTRLKRSARVLLEEFAQRFDRTFVPVGEIVVR